MPRLLAPRYWAGHALLIVAIVGTGVLGAWQVGAWQDKRAAEVAGLSRAEPVPVADLIGPDDPFPGDQVGRPVRVQGTWIDGVTVLVSGREYDGRDGLWMVRVLDLGEAAIPVVIGWVDADAEAPAPPDGPAALTGWLQPPDGTGEFDDDPGDDVVPQLRIADLQQRVVPDLYSAYVVAQGGLQGLPEADLSALPESSRFTALRNLLYGLEWWVFGLFAVFVWWRWIKEMEPADTVEA